MAFRADEAINDGYVRVRDALVHRDLSSDGRREAEDALQDIIDRCGPPVDAYPTWHPLVWQQGRNPVRYPGTTCGYEGLDHTFYFVNGFVTCPYSDGQSVIESAYRIDCPRVADIEAEILDIQFYSNSTTTVVVRCNWTKPLDGSYMIPKSLAVPLMIEKELPAWNWSEVGETWETMRPYLLGQPHGSRSSLFVSQDTALAMKRVHTAMLESGMYGPIMV